MIVDLTLLLTGEDPGGTWAAGPCTGPNTNPQVVSIADPTMVNFTGVIPGLYTFSYTVSGGAGCTSCAEVDVDVNETPLVTITPDPLTVCTIDGVSSFMLTAGVVNLSNGGAWTGSTPLTYAWTRNGTPIAPNTATITVNNLTPGSYTYGVTVTTPDSPPCVGTDTASVTVLPNVSAGANASTTICQNETINLTSLLSGVVKPAGATDSWLQTGGPAVDITDPTAVTFTATGTYTFSYTVTLTSGATVCSDSAIITVVVTTTPTAGTGSSTEICN